MIKAYNISQKLLWLSVSYDIDNKREEFEIDFDLNYIIAYGDLGTYSFDFIKYERKTPVLLSGGIQANYHIFY